MLNRKAVVVILFATVMSTGCALMPGSQYPSGPLTVHPTHSRWFADAEGEAVYLTGSHVWTNFQDYERHAPMDFDAYLDVLEQHGHNFIRGWVTESVSAFIPNYDKQVWWKPPIYARTGPGMALDGEPKFDVTEFSPEFFERIRSRAEEAGRRGFYVSIMLFQGWSLTKDEKSGRDSWIGHPFHKENNINGVDGDLNGDGEGIEVHTLESTRILGIQERYVCKMIDELGDLDHIIWEISNESPVTSFAWQYHMIRFIKEYEATKPKQHLVWMNCYGKDFPEKHLWESPADVISPHRFDTPSYRGGAPVNRGDKIVILDTDHLWGVGGNRYFVWSAFMRGYHPIFMDPIYVRNESKYTPFDPRWVGIREAMGDTLRYARRMDLNHTVPSASPDLSSTQFCLTNPNRQYLIYQPARGKDFQARLTAGRYAYEWFDTDASKVVDSGVVQLGGGGKTYVNPCKGSAMLFLEKE